MTDTDLIRRCVERVRGFDIINGELLVSGLRILPCKIDAPHQVYLDALAAEMVRMVDAIDTLHVMVGRRDTRIARAYEAIVEVTGPDRTENTLRACDEFFTENQGQDNKEDML